MDVRRAPLFSVILRKADLVQVRGGTMFFLVNSIVMIVAGIFALITMSGWVEFRGKNAFRWFLILGFIAVPAIGLFPIVLGWFLPWRVLVAVPNLVWIFFEGLACVLTIFACLMLLVFAIQLGPSLRTESREHIDSFTSQRPRVPPERMRYWWRTDQTQKERIEVLRRREWAFLIDLWPLSVPLVFFALLYGNLSLGNPIRGISVTMVGFGFVGILLYLPIKEMHLGKSVGKHFSKCTVVDLDSGHPIGMRESLIRNILFVIPLMALVELAVASFRSDRRRIGDLLANTIVVADPPDSIDGVEQVRKQAIVEEPKVHPLDA
jgi:uncharacterized RDD family membrane protein YckC